MKSNIDFEYGKTYHVTHRVWDDKIVCPKRDKDTKLVRAKRQFIMKEQRFGPDGITCFVFTSRITSRMIFNQSIISIPHYDLIDVKEA